MFLKCSNVRWRWFIRFFYKTSGLEFRSFFVQRDRKKYCVKFMYTELWFSSSFSQVDLIISPFLISHRTEFLRSAKNLISCDDCLRKIVVFADSRILVIRVSFKSGRFTETQLASRISHQISFDIESLFATVFFLLRRTKINVTCVFRPRYFVLGGNRKLIIRERRWFHAGSLPTDLNLIPVLVSFLLPLLFPSYFCHDESKRNSILLNTPKTLNVFHATHASKNTLEIAWLSTRRRISLCSTNFPPPFPSCFLVLPTAQHLHSYFDMERHPDCSLARVEFAVPTLFIRANYQTIVSKISLTLLSSFLSFIERKITLTLMKSQSFANISS